MTRDRTAPCVWDDDDDETTQNSHVNQKKRVRSCAPRLGKMKGKKKERKDGRCVVYGCGMKKHALKAPPSLTPVFGKFDGWPGARSSLEFR